MPLVFNTDIVDCRYVKFAMTNLVKNMETHEADGDEDVQEAVSPNIFISLL